MSLVVVQAIGLVTVQDLGRPGHMHEGLAPGGALVRGMLVAANRAAGNPGDVAAIEVIGRLVARAESDVVLARARPDGQLASTGDIRATTLRAGDEVTLDSEPARVVYLGLRGGVDAPRVLGSRATQLSAGLGTRLRAGDRIAVAPRARGVMAARPRPEVPRRAARPARASDAIRVVPGPDLEAFAPGALDALASAAYRVLPTSDRVGTRLEGPIVPRRRGEVPSRPMVRGAIEVPEDGAPIVLGPEHPTTGGYPIIGVVIDDDLDRLFAVRVNGHVRFEVGHVDTHE